MTSDMNPPEQTIDTASEATQSHAELTPPGDATGETTDWQKLLAKVQEYISFDVISEVFEQYKQPILTVALVLAAIIAVKVVLAVLGALHEIPLLSPLFEMIGIGYTAWFVYRYVLKADNRSELVNDFTALKNQVLGGK
ncbi:MAG: CAAD domain-containing protein [Cyanobacteria bacterium P01_H01_bin.121]